jgi:hypothetical protein
MVVGLMGLQSKSESIFWRYIDQSDYYGCWIWTGPKLHKKYGYFNGDAAHRQMYRMILGEIPKGYHVHHKCCTTLCMNPNHLETLSPKEHRRWHVEQRLRRVGEAFVSVP